MIKWLKIELVRAINSTLMHGIQNNFAQVIVWQCHLKLLVGYVKGQGHTWRLKDKMVINRAVVAVTSTFK